MADDTAKLQAQLASLKSAYYSGVLSCDYEGKRVTYRSASELREAIAACERALGIAQPVRSVLVRTSSKGW